MRVGVEYLVFPPLLVWCIQQQQVESSGRVLSAVGDVISSAARWVSLPSSASLSSPPLSSACPAASSALLSSTLFCVSAGGGVVLSSSGAEVLLSKSPTKLSVCARFSSRHSRCHWRSSCTCGSARTYIRPALQLAYNDHILCKKNSGVAGPLAAQGGGQICRPFVLGFWNWRTCLKSKFEPDAAKDPT